MVPEIPLECCVRKCVSVLRGTHSRTDMSMRVLIHRGSHEIGGNCVEVESGGARIILDLGRPLDAGPDEQVPLPPISGLDGNDPSLLGIVISHPHQDHYGLASGISGKVPIFIGEAASNILRQAAFFRVGGLTGTPAGLLRDRVPFERGPFRITPFLVDHSAFDSYSLLVEAGGRRLFYTGDFRATGAKAALFHRLLRDPLAPIDVLLMEGTHVRAEVGPHSGCKTELQVADAMASTITASLGMVLVAYSGQNIDRLVSVFKAARRSHRELVVDLYTALIARATGNRKIPQAGFDGLRVFVPQHHRVLIKKQGAFHLVDEIKACRIFEQEVAARANELVVTFRKSMEPTLAKSPNVLRQATAIWSQWPGYLDIPSGASTRDFCQRHGIPITIHHTSGHAGIADLQRLAKALKPGRVVPIHTSAPERFAQHFNNVAAFDDRVGWEV
jgi:ribonuclease J